MRLCQAACCYIVTENAVKLVLPAMKHMLEHLFFFSTGLENEHALFITSWIFLT